MTELEDVTSLKINEESKQRIVEVSNVSREAEQRVEAVQTTFVNRLNLVEK